MGKALNLLRRVNRSLHDPMGKWMEAVSAAADSGGAGGAAAGLGHVYFVDDKLGNDATAQPDSLARKYKTIQAAIDQLNTDAVSGSTVLVAPGRYVERVDFSPTVADATLMGLDAATCVIENPASSMTAALYCGSPAPERLTIKDLRVVGTDNGNPAVLVLGVQGSRPHQVILDHILAIGTDGAAGSSGMEIQQSANVLVRDCYCRQGGATVYALAINNCGNVAVVGTRTEGDLALMYNEASAAPSRGTYLLDDGVYINGNVNITEHPSVIATRGVDVNGAVLTGALGALAPLTLGDTLGSSIEFHGTANEANLTFASFDAAKLQYLSLVDASFIEDVTLAVNFPTGSMTNRFDLDNMRVKGAFTLGEGLAATAEGAVFPQAAAYAFDSVGLNSDAIWTQTMNDGLQTRNILLPWPQLNTDYIIVAVFKSGTPQAYVITNKTLTAFDITLPAAAAGSVSFDLYLKRKTVS